jgi:hypothetical protein
MGPKIYEAQDTNGFSNGLLFVRFPERDIVGHLLTFYCNLFAKWKSFLGSTNLQNGKASRPLKGSSHESLCIMYTVSYLVTRRGPSPVTITMKK